MFREQKTPLSAAVWRQFAARALPSSLNPWMKPQPHITFSNHLATMSIPFTKTVSIERQAESIEYSFLGNDLGYTHISSCDLLYTRLRSKRVSDRNQNVRGVRNASRGRYDSRRDDADAR